jgi:hypothetical protein
MGDWLRSLRRNWDTLLAGSLTLIAIGIYLGPVYYFVVWYVLGCAYIIRVALKR